MNKYGWKQRTVNKRTVTIGVGYTTVDTINREIFCQPVEILDYRLYHGYMLMLRCCAMWSRKHCLHKYISIKV